MGDLSEPRRATSAFGTPRPNYLGKSRPLFGGTADLRGTILIERN
jgi:hypothetical protein